MKKVTPWLRGKPARVGVYERKMNAGGALHSYWDGTLWYANSYSGPDHAFEQYKRRNISSYQGLQYRGLAVKP